MISHLALIMDGNRRWAKQRSLMPWLGHRQGAKNVEMAVQYCLENNISNLSLYTFSLENFKRTPKEVSYLFSMIAELSKKVNEFVKTGVQIRFVGDRSKIPSDTKKVCEEVEIATQSCDKLVCNFLFCYGGQQEIVAAAQKLVDQNKQKITIEDFKQATWLGDVPDPEIIIRTGGVKRLSNFLLFQGAYSEVRFLDCFWPDLTRDVLSQTVQDCLDAKKNVGQ